jgi:long-chain-fatty-acid--[acyl-carrier-protein] ligase
MLLVRGPSIFEGYIGDAPSPFVDFDGQSWYRTGDLVREGKDGVLTFHGRLKRFIKLGGEMISLPAIESVLQQHFTSEGHEGPTIAIEATPSEDHPEVVLFTTQPADRAGVNRMIRDAGLSGLHNVSRVILVDEIPVLGTGKTDYRALEQQLADADGETTESTQHA